MHYFEYSKVRHKIFEMFLIDYIRYWLRLTLYTLKSHSLPPGFFNFFSNDPGLIYDLWLCDGAQNKKSKNPCGTFGY